MNKLILAGAGMILAAAMSAQDPEGSLVYSLPSTTVRLQVKAQKENFYLRSVCEICPEISGNRCASEGCRDLYRDVRDHGVIH